MKAVEESCEERLRELYPAKVGTTLIRLRARDKRPLDSGWNIQAVENFQNEIDPQPILASIADHLARGGNVGWAIPPGVLVLDADTDKAASWLCEAFPDAPRQRTAKGCHVVVLEPLGVDLRQVTDFELVDGIRVDLRTSGSGQIAVEPSIHPSGFEYHWEIELPLDLENLPGIPPAIIERMKASEQVQGPVDISAATWREGSRETRLVSMAGRFRNMSLSENEIFVSLLEINRQRCDPQLPDRDIQRIAHSAGKWDRGEDPTKNDPDTIVAEASDLFDFAFTGARLDALLGEEKPPPVYPGTPPQGHFSLLIAPSFSGKTSLALWVAMARIRGVSPWIGAPERSPGRVLFYSIDEPPAQVAWRIKDLSQRHPGGRLVRDYFDGFVIVGPHRSVDPEKLEQLRFTEAGIRILDTYLRQADDAGEPFTDIVIDAYSDMLPLGESDTSNEEATRIGGHLERLAVTHDVAVQMIHHAGKPKVGTDAPDPRDMGRGASALAAKARAIFTVEEEPGLDGVRKIRTRTNLTEGPGPLLLEVAAERSRDGTRIDFFRPHDPAVAYPIDGYLTVDDGWISTTDLAIRLSPKPIEDRSKLSGPLKAEAAQVRGIWDTAGLIEIRSGPRNSLEMRRKKGTPAGSGE